jgi:hypothetical protein
VAPGPEGSSLHSQQPATSTYPEPTESTSHPSQPVCPRCILIPSSHLCLSRPSSLLPLGFSTKTLCTFLSSQCMKNIISLFPFV